MLRQRAIAEILRHLALLQAEDVLVGIHPLTDPITSEVVAMVDEAAVLEAVAAVVVEGEEEEEEDGVVGVEVLAVVQRRAVICLAAVGGPEREVEAGVVVVVVVDHRPHEENLGRSANDDPALELQRSLFEVGALL